MIQPVGRLDLEPHRAGRDRREGVDPAPLIVAGHLDEILPESGTGLGQQPVVSDRFRLGLAPEHPAGEAFSLGEGEVAV